METEESSYMQSLDNEQPHVPNWQTEMVTILSEKFFADSPFRQLALYPHGVEGHERDVSFFIYSLNDAAVKVAATLTAINRCPDTNCTAGLIGRSSSFVKSAMFRV